VKTSDKTPGTLIFVLRVAEVPDEKVPEDLECHDIAQIEIRCSERCTFTIDFWYKVYDQNEGATYWEKLASKAYDSPEAWVTNAISQKQFYPSKKVQSILECILEIGLLKLMRAANKYSRKHRCC
jgi:hypothetical protein